MSIKRDLKGNEPFNTIRQPRKEKQKQVIYNTRPSVRERIWEKAKKKAKTSRKT